MEFVLTDGICLGAKTWKSRANWKNIYIYRF